jgi:hypothetical protein
VRKKHRKFVVFATLIGVLTLTSALLLALAPEPLVPDAYSSLFAIDAPRTMDVIFETKVPATQGRWKYIYIHHSRTASGNAITLGQNATGLGDHFVIGNGDGCVDGEIQIGQRWNQQLAATPPAADATIDPACISICLIGDFDRTVPTPTQLRRLAQLSGALQGQLRIGADGVLLVNHAASPAGIGRYFPASAFRGQILP